MVLKSKEGDEECSVVDILKEMKNAGYGKEVARKSFEENYVIESAMLDKICEQEFD